MDLAGTWTCLYWFSPPLSDVTFPLQGLTEGDVCVCLCVWRWAARACEAQRVSDRDHEQKPDLSTAAERLPVLLSSCWTMSMIFVFHLETGLFKSASSASKSHQQCETTSETIRQKRPQQTDSLYCGWSQTSIEPLGWDYRIRLKRSDYRGLIKGVRGRGQIKGFRLKWPDYRSQVEAVKLEGSDLRGQNKRARLRG